jgi:hypothetical protein
LSAKSYKIEKKIKKFEQAIIPDKESFVLPKIDSILLALDAHNWVIGSSRYSYQVACELSIKNDAYVQIICMAINDEEYYESEKLVEEAVEYFNNNNVKSQGICIIGSPSDNILKLSEDEKHDLIVIPSPYAERVEKDNVESLGATIEILINKSVVPLLLLTESSISPEKITERILLPVHGKDGLDISGWALFLSDKDSIINVFDTVRIEVVEEIKGVSLDLLEEDVNERLIEISLRKNTAAIISALKEIAEEMGIRVVISKKVGDLVEILAKELTMTKTSLLIVNSWISLEQGSTLVKESKKNQVPLLIIK